MSVKRVFVVVVDAWGVGALPDAPEYGDSPHCNTMGNIDQAADSLSLPNLERLGLGNILPLSRVQPQEKPLGSYGKMSEFSRGKDTTTGHWEMAGIYLETPFPTYPNGFPPDIVARFKQETGINNILGNRPASGTQILEELGMQHLETGDPIVYTSADSVFQIAAHVGPESKTDLATLYQWCEKAREILDGPHQVSRVIARPFVGNSPDTFKRVGKDRRDYAVLPPEATVLNRIREAGAVVLGVGKIEDIFCFSGLTHSIHTGSNPEGIEVLHKLIQNQQDLDALSLEKKALGEYPQADKQFIFVNLVETDSNYGHRRDVNGYARSLEQFDAALGPILAQLGEGDLLMISADHGCDPTAPGSDHTREYVPILLYSPQLPAVNLGIRESFADIGKTTLAWLELDDPAQRGHNMLETLAQKNPALV
ncbi:phosphopentomutase [Vampirovibrio sp.]|uniref:phosphopentomutase n=1 Tax=Vampirovibrio sp. TaxID=2717857 RepID=UPI003593A9EE